MKKVFISYSHKDEKFKEQFETHLSGLIRQNLIELWTDSNIYIGDKWDQKIKEKLMNSDVVIFLLSSDFLSSEYINEIEIKKTIERHNRNEVLIAPIFLRPCDFESSLLSSFQGVPREAKFISTWDDIDSAFYEVTREFKKLVNEFKPNKTTQDIQQPINISIPECDTPPDIAKWVGRNKELELLDSSHFKVIFITGIGGQGKSSLATKYVQNQMELANYDYWDWRDFKEEENRLKTKVIEIIVRFSDLDQDISLLKDANYEELVEIFFKSIGERKILFVFDNIDSYIDYESFNPINGFKQLIQHALTRRHNCKFIFTCRPFIKKADVGFYQIELPGLLFNHTKTLLDKYTISVKENKREDLYKKLHEITNGHPLWLNLLGAQAVSGIDKLEEFIKNISEHTSFKEDNFTNILSDEIIGALWKSLNYKQQKLLRCLSEMLKCEEVDDIAKMIENELNYNQFMRSLKRLKLLNLVVTKTKQSQKEEIELHPLVKNFVKSKYPPNERSKYISIIIDYYDKVTYILKKRLSGNESLSFYENWTNKVELAINKKDFTSALSYLQEITDSILTAGYFEEYYRVASILFDKIDFSKTYNNETPYFIAQVISFVELSAEINEFKTSRKILDRFRENINDKGKDYIIYCKLECSYHWHKLENTKAINWGEKAMVLIKKSKADLDYNLEHSLNLAKRDSRIESRLDEALIFFKKGHDIDEILNDQVNENLSAQFYGNLGRCFYLKNNLEVALKLYIKTFKLVYKEETSMKYMNRGFISHWIGQLLQKKGENKLAYLFYSNAIFYWKKHSPHRAMRVEEEIKILRREIPDFDDLLKMDSETKESQCKKFIYKGIQQLKS